MNNLLFDNSELSLEDAPGETVGSTESPPFLNVSIQNPGSQIVRSTTAAGDILVMYVSLVALNNKYEFSINENEPVERILLLVKSLFEDMDYFKPCPAGSFDWNIDLVHRGLSILNMVNLITYRGEEQSNLLVKHLLYGGEIFEPRFFEVQKPPVTRAPTEFKWNPRQRRWDAKEATGEMLLLDSQLAVHDKIIYTPFTSCKHSLSETSMQLTYLRWLYEQLRMPLSQLGYQSAVVYVGTGSLTMAVVKSYSWAGDAGQGIGKIVEWGAEHGVVQDTNGTQRVLRFRQGRGVWMEDRKEMSTGTLRIEQMDLFGNPAPNVVIAQTSWTYPTRIVVKN
ncbi:hypothetical protein TWF730_008830 [Orbilia blumenaviensis]|uniref:Uncharacterized protein n=1 Tax=Orbilia blumenaviensis TaxID=1796055 RepID=A0AAV9V6I9_9PEZI